MSLCVCLCVCVCVHSWVKIWGQLSGVISFLSSCVYPWLNSGTITWWAISLASLSFLFIWTFWIWRWARLGWPHLVRYTMNFKYRLETFADEMKNGRQGLPRLESQTLCGWSAVWSPPFEGQWSLIHLVWGTESRCSHCIGHVLEADQYRTSHMDSNTQRLSVLSSWRQAHLGVSCCSCVWQRMHKALQTSAPVHTRHGAFWVLAGWAAPVTVIFYLSLWLSS